MAAPKNLVQPRAYELTNTPIPFSRGTWFRWEKTGVIPPLLRLGGKTLVPSETIEAILSGRIRLPQNAGRIQAPTPHDRGGHTKRNRKSQPAQSASAE
jgi:hypothetical protein